MAQHHILQCTYICLKRSIPARSREMRCTTSQTPLQGPVEIAFKSAYMPKSRLTLVDEVLSSLLSVSIVLELLVELCTVVDLCLDKLRRAAVRCLDEFSRSERRDFFFAFERTCRLEPSPPDPSPTPEMESRIVSHMNFGRCRSRNTAAWLSGSLCGL